MNITQSQRREALKAIKRSPAFNQFILALKAEEQDLRDIYEAQEASEYNRGMLRGVQHVIKQLEGA